MAYFPMMVDMESASVLVIGGGETALRKAKQLISFGAHCHVIAPQIAEGFNELSCDIMRRGYEAGDIERLMPLTAVIAATDNHELNHSIGEACRELNIMVNVVDDPRLSTFVFPAVVRKADIVCGISSGAKSPLVSQYLKDAVTRAIPDKICGVNEEMGRYKEELLRNEPDIGKRRALLKEKFAQLMTSEAP